MKNPIGPLVVLIFFVAEVLIVNPQIFEMYAETWHGFFLGLLAFFFGFLFVYTGKTFWQTVLKWRWGYLGLAAVLYIIRLVEFNTTAPGYLAAIESNLWIFSLFGFGYRYLNRPSRVLSYLSQAAYPVYIIHMFALYAGAFLILPLNIEVEFKLIAIVSFTGIVCYLGYEFIIRRVGFLRPIFGLKYNRFQSDQSPVKLAEPELNPVPTNIKNS